MRPSFSDLISNLRSLHQILVVTCVALLTTLLLSKPPENISAAIVELQKIEKLTGTNNWNPLFLEEFYGKDDGLIMGYGDDVFHFKTWNINFHQAELSRNNEPISDDHTVLMQAPIDIFVGWEYIYELLKGAEPYITPPNSLEELAAIWQKANRLQVFTVDSLKNYAYVQRAPNLPVEKVDITVLDSESYYSREKASGLYGVFRLNIFPPDAVLPEDRTLYGLGYILENSYYYNHKWKIWIPANIRPGDMLSSHWNSTFDATILLCEKAGISQEECNQSIEQVFPNLFETAEDHVNLPFATLHDYLQNKQDSFYEDFEFLGIKIPARLISIAGSLILLALQLSFTLHIYATNVIEKNDTMPAWLGTFHNWIPRAISIITISFLPIFSMYIAKLKSLNQNQIWTTAFNCLIYLGTALSILIITKFFFLWKRIDEPNCNQFKEKPITNKKILKKKNTSFLKRLEK
jgi:hypothetical protein